MMLFRALKNSIVQRLSDEASGRYIVIGNQRENKSVEEIRNCLVQVYYKSGDFSSSSGRQTGPLQHNITYEVLLSVSAASSGDITALRDQSSTPEQLTTALANFSEAAFDADEKIDELFENVFQVLLAGPFYDFGQEKGVVSKRWISAFNKDDPVPRGDLVSLTGSFNLNVQVAEQIPSATETPAQILDSSVETDGTAQTGTIIE